MRKEGKFFRDLYFSNLYFGQLISCDKNFSLFLDFVMLWTIHTKFASELNAVQPNVKKELTRAFPQEKGVAPGRCPVFQAATPLSKTFLRIATGTPVAFDFSAKVAPAETPNLSSNFL